jgi:hypothetical protein
VALSLRRQGGAADLAVNHHYVAMCDVLGYRELLKVHGIDWLAGRYSALEEHVRLLFQWEVKAHLFSDTILVYSEPLDRFLSLDDKELRRLLMYQRTTGFLGATAALFTTGLTLGVPLRVGIAFGPAVLEPSRQLFLGAPVVDAYEVEASQDWIGIGIDPRTFRWAEQAVADGDFWRLMRWEVPVKPDAKHRDLYWSVNWSTLGLGREALSTTLDTYLERFASTKYADRWDRTTSFYRAAVAKPLAQGGAGAER